VHFSRIVIVISLFGSGAIAATANAARAQPDEGREAVAQALTSENTDDRTFRISDLHGHDVQIRQLQFKDQVLRGQSEQGAVSWPLDELIRITPAGRVANARPNDIPSSTWHFELNDRSTFDGKLMPIAGADSARVVEIDAALGSPLRVRLSAIAALRAGADSQKAALADFEQRIRHRETGRDTIIVIADGKPVALQGSLESLSPDTWEFKVAGKVRRGDYATVFGFVLGAPAVTTGSTPATLHTSTEARLGVRIYSADVDGVTVESDLFDRFTIPWDRVKQIDLRSDRVVRIADLKPVHAEQRSLPGAAWPVRTNTNVTGGPLRLGGIAYGHGLGVHASNALTYSLHGEYERFAAVVGLDDSTQMRGSVIFRVRVDGKVLFESGLMRGGDAPKTVSVELAGADVLVLETDAADQLDLGDHANWANAVLIRKSDRTNDAAHASARAFSQMH